MKYDLSDYCQRELNYAIVDEVDSILIDEARTPLSFQGLRRNQLINIIKSIRLSRNFKKIPTIRSMKRHGPLFLLKKAISK